MVALDVASASLFSLALSSLFFSHSFILIFRLEFVYLFFGWRKGCSMFISLAIFFSTISTAFSGQVMRSISSSRPLESCCWCWVLMDGMMNAGRWLAARWQPGSFSVLSSWVMDDGCEPAMAVASVSFPTRSQSRPKSRDREGIKNTHFLLHALWIWVSFTLCPNSIIVEFEAKIFGDFFSVVEIWKIMMSNDEGCTFRYRRWWFFYAASNGKEEVHSDWQRSVADEDAPAVAPAHFNWQRGPGTSCCGDRITSTESDIKSRHGRVERPLVTIPRRPRRSRA